MTLHMFSSYNVFSYCLSSNSLGCVLTTD